jgi:hypothetical protein
VANASKKSTPEKRALILWALLVQDGAGAFQNELRPEPEKGDRDGLAEDGLITWQKRGRRIWIEATDKGWVWAGENLSADLPRRSSDGSQVLQAWLTRLKTFMDARGIILAEILAPAPAPERSEARENLAAARPATIRESDRIRQAYLELTGGRLNQRVPLTDIRQRLTDLDRAAVDDALMKMHLEEGATLSGMENPREITSAIRDAGLIFKGEQMFVLWITK